jgi:uncharacterized protein YodC (DUF2158 family)
LIDSSGKSPHCDILLSRRWPIVRAIFPWELMEPIMKLKAGDVVVLKSGGQALTVAEVNDENIECIWIGEEGELFRETLPAVTLELAAIEDDEEEDEEENGDEEEDDEDEDDEKAVA